MEDNSAVPVDAVASKPLTPPVDVIPTPTANYRQHRKAVQMLNQPGRPILARGPTAATAVAPSGARMLIWKQDPSVGEIGVRKVFVPGVILAGPRDARVESGAPGIAPVSPNTFGDFVTTPDTDEFDAVHTYAVVRQTLTMYQRALATGGSPAMLPWAWNNGANTHPIRVFPHGLPNVVNAYYSRNEKALKFGHFIPNGGATRVYTSRSFDIVSHEAGHAVLDGLKPGWLQANNPPQTGGLHESFGDLTAIFLTLSQLDQCEAIVAQTKADLHDKTFLADMAEEFGMALGRPNGLRNADNNFTLSETGNQVHAISQVFTGAIYDIMADIFAFERNPALKDDAATLHAVGDTMRSLVLRAIVAAPERGARYVDVVNQMLAISAADGKPIEHRNFIRNQFTVREVVISPLALTDDVREGEPLEADWQDDPEAVQDRRCCCGTMNQPEYFNYEALLERERRLLAQWCTDNGCGAGLDEAAAEGEPVEHGGVADPRHRGGHGGATPVHRA